MSNKNHEQKFDQNIINALKNLPQPIFDSKHNITIRLEEEFRKKENRYEHIAKKYHQIRVKDIECIPNGIKNYVKFKKSPDKKRTFYYFIKRKVHERGFICVAIQTDKNNNKTAFIKTVFIVYRIKYK